MLQIQDYFSKISDSTRLKWIYKIISISFLLGIVLSYKLWQSDRLFPLVPVFEAFTPFNNSFSLIFYILLISSCLLGIFNYYKKGLVFFLLVLAVLLLQDQMRWQPWVYMYVLLLLGYLYFDKKGNDTLIINYLKSIVVGVYLWSAIQKIHPYFNETSFKSILKEVFLLQPEQIDILVSYQIGYSIPLIELCIPILLLLPKYRTIGVYLAILMHVFIIGYASPLSSNNNFIILPWNIALIGITTFLFYKNTSQFSVKSHFLNYTALLLVWCLPLLNFFGLWDHYLSFSLYSGKIPYHYVTSTDDVFKDTAYQTYLVSSKKFNSDKVLNMYYWSMSELNVPFYPEPRVFKAVAKQLCNSVTTKEQLEFITVKMLPEPTIINTFNCN